MKTYLVYLSIGHAIDDGVSNCVELKAASFKKIHSVSGNSTDPGIATVQFVNEDGSIAAEFQSSWIVGVVDKKSLA